MSFSQKTQEPGQNRAWWKADREASLSRRVAEINRINDPGTNADEVLRAAKWIILALLCYSGLLGGLSYLKNFEAFLPFPIAIFLALALTLVIEFGKNSATKWALRAPFFQGFRNIFRAPENTLMWLGLIALSVGTFTMSVINSTAGSEQLARMLTTERDTSGGFRSDTRDIDAQIATINSNIEAARHTQWRGTTTTTSQRTILEAQKSLTTLSAQREQAIATQRADWEATQAKKTNNDNYTASLVLASGGWVEGLVFILLVIAVSCEKILDSRQAGSSSPTPSPEAGIGYRRAATPSTALPSYSDQPPIPTEPTAPPRRPIGFLRDREVDLPEAQTAAAEQFPAPAVPPKIYVEQSVQQEQAIPITTETSLRADVKEWEKRCKLYFNRACTQQREQYRLNNAKRTICYATMLEAVGYHCSILFQSQYISIRPPAEEQHIDEQATATIREQKTLLEQIGKEGRV